MILALYSSKEGNSYGWLGMVHQLIFGLTNDILDLQIISILNAKAHFEIFRMYPTLFQMVIQIWISFSQL